MSPSSKCDSLKKKPPAERVQRILVCGDRNWKDYRLIEDILDQYTDPSLVVIEGDAKGADRLAGKWATLKGYELLKFPANWRLYGPAAGYIRNQQMLDEGKPTQVIAFHDSITTSKGTADMIRRAQAAKLPVLLITHGGWVSL